MFGFLGFGKSKGLDLDFDPELNMISMHNGEIITIRISSGDELNINKNLRVALEKSTSQISLVLDGFDQYEFETNPSNGEPQFIKGKALLEIKDLSGNSEGADQSSKTELTEHRIAVYPEKVKNQKRISYKFPPIEEVKKEIQDIWQDEFANALEDYTLAANETSEISNRKRKSANNEGLSLTSKICIALILLALIIFGYTKFIKSNQVQNNGDQTIMSMYDEINNLPNNPENNPTTSNEKTADQEALEEFGLEEGIKLD